MNIKGWLSSFIGIFVLFTILCCEGSAQFDVQQVMYSTVVCPGSCGSILGDYQQAVKEADLSAALAISQLKSIMALSQGDAKNIATSLQDTVNDINHGGHIEASLKTDLVSLKLSIAAVQSTNPTLTSQQLQEMVYELPALKDFISAITQSRQQVSCWKTGGSSSCRVSYGCLLGEPGTKCQISIK